MSNVATIETGGLCHTCDTSLPLTISETPQDEAIWLCAKCGLPIAARCLNDELEQMASRVRLHRKNFDTSDLPPISSTLCRQVAVLVGRDPRPEQLERRRSPRVKKSIAVPAIRIGDDGNPVGLPINVLIADLSLEGVGLVHSDRFVENRIALQLPSGDRDYPIQMIVRIVRHRALAYPFFDVGGEFLLRLGGTSPDRTKLPIDALPKQ